MPPQIFLQGGSVSKDIKIYTSATLGKQGPLTSTFGRPQDFADSSVGKILPAMLETSVQFLGREGPLEK